MNHEFITEGDPYPVFSLTQDGKPVSDEQIKEWLSELISCEESAYGYRKLTVCLQRDYQLIINKKKVYRLMKESDLRDYSTESTVGNGRKIRVHCWRTSFLFPAMSHRRL
ncbi:transposase [Brevibacillus sp. H7]|uniref:transposase n=1 Tax=Brevibacillus sp. H7 TaxID=3349138 RepID=UPI0037F61FDB